jgi:uncharacterized protein YcbK (DUF882 family)
MALVRCTVPLVALATTAALGCGSSPTIAASARSDAAPLIDDAIADVRAGLAPDEPPRPTVAWASTLEPLAFRDVSTGEVATVRLYDDTGQIDETAASAIDHLLASDDAAAVARAEGAPSTLDRRLLQLVVKIATREGAREVAVVSAFRASKRRGSRHRTGQAMDFVLPGVPAAKLAAALRHEARVGVGVYTHPRTRFVHLDVRDTSYHWLDASPPGRLWREARLADPGGPARDAAYRPDQDLPLVTGAVATKR